MKAIIPCAGFGTRMGMQPDQSKEMLPIRYWSSAPLIDRPATLLKDTLVISRKEKTDLNQYVTGIGKELLIIEPKGEWMDTVLASKDRWADTNILIFPDVDCYPEYTAIEQMQFNLEELEHPTVLALHHVQDPSKWCILDGALLREKPKGLPEGKYLAMGMLGWRKEHGEYLFSNLSKYGYVNVWSDVPCFKLTYFEDLTRAMPVNGTFG